MYNGPFGQRRARRRHQRRPALRELEEAVRAAAERAQAARPAQIIGRSRPGREVASSTLYKHGNVLREPPWPFTATCQLLCNRDRSTPSNFKGFVRQSAIYR
jgi:hypothetical protein